MEMMVDLVNVRQYDLIILDSVASLISKVELENDMESNANGVGQVMNLLCLGLCNEFFVCPIFLDQSQKLICLLWILNLQAISIW